jgi:N-acetylmuramoyl-L-alanine amidase
MRLAALLTIAFFLAVRTFAATVGEWNLFKVEGRDYVSMENIADFYGLTDVRRVNNDVTLKVGNRSLRGTAGSVEFFINGLKFNLSYPVVDVDGKLGISRMDLAKVIEPVLRPSKIKGAEVINTIILDAGHGGHDNGAYSPFGHEKQFTLDVVQRTRLLLLQSGYKVVLTRGSDVFIPLHERTAIANRYPNAVFISIHFNSGGAGTGLETYTLAPRGVPSMMADGPRVSDLNECAGNVCDPQNMALATAMHASLVARSRMYDRGIKRARFVVIRDIKIPGVLIEGGFLSNTVDAKWVATPAYRQQMATCIVQAISNYRRAVGSNNGVVASRGSTPNQKGPRVEVTGNPVPPAEPAPEPVGITPASN